MQLLVGQALHLEQLSDLLLKGAQHAEARISRLEPDVVQSSL